MEGPKPWRKDKLGWKQVGINFVTEWGGAWKLPEGEVDSSAESQTRREGGQRKERSQEPWEWGLLGIWGPARPRGWMLSGPGVHARSSQHWGWAEQATFRALITGCNHEVQGRDEESVDPRSQAGQEENAGQEWSRSGT